MNLHLPTLLLLATLQAVFIAILLLDAWRTAGRPAYLLAWVGYCALAGVAMGGFMLRDQVPEVLVIWGANMAALLAKALHLAGARLLRGRRVLPWLLPVPLVLWGLACLVPWIYGSMHHRVVVYCLLMFGLSGWTVVELRRGLAPDATGRAEAWLAWLVGACGLIDMARGTAILLGADMPLTHPHILFIALTPGLIGFMSLNIAHTRLARREAVLRAEAGEREAAVLRDTWAQVEQLHAGLPALIFMREVRPDGSTHSLYWGGDQVRVSGWSPEVVEQRNLTELAHPETPLAEAAKALLRDGSHTLEWRLRQPDGGWSQMRTSARVLHYRPDGSAVVVGYTLNVTREHEAHARAMVTGRLASLAEMGMGLAHELKQPLQAISLHAEMAQLHASRLGASEIEHSLDAALVQVNRAAQVIEHLRRFARGPEAGQPTEVVPLDLALEGALILVGGQLRQAEITLETELGDPPAAVMGQLLGVEQVLTNLLLNARDAMQCRPAHLPRRVRVSVCRQPAQGTVQVQVADTGGGLPPKVLAHLFQPFITTKGPDKGTGLGLSICQGVLETMGGRIEGRNEGEGAVFTFTLPAAPGSQHACPAERQRCCA